MATPASTAHAPSTPARRSWSGTSTNPTTTPDRRRTGTQILVSELDEVVKALPWRAKANSARGTVIAGPTCFPSGRYTEARRPMPLSLSSWITDESDEGGVCEARMLESERAS